VAALLLMAGCSLLPTTPAPESVLEAPPPGDLLRLELDAPAPLARLLREHLDVARLERVPGGEPVSATELGRLVAATPVQVRELLETEGYFEPVVQVRREPGRPPVVVVVVQPGPRTRVGRLVQDVEGPMQDGLLAGDARARQVLERWRRQWPLKVDDAFRNPAWVDAKASSLAQLQAEGYVAARWAFTHARIDVDAGTADLQVQAASGPLFRTGDLRVEGLQFHDESTVRNLANFDRGAPATEALLLDFQQRLQTSGLFELASVGLDPDPAQAAAVPVRVRLRELPLQQFNVGLGYSALNGQRVSLEHRHRRPFGLPLQARHRFELGRDRQTAEGEVSSHPQRNLWRNVVGYGLSRLETESDVVTSSRLRVGRQQDTPRVQRQFYVEGTRDLRRTDVERDSAGAVTANANWIFRRLDNPLLPTRGWTLSLQNGVGVARDSDGDSGPFTRLYGRLTGYQPLPAGFFGQARLELGQVFAAGQVTVPDTLRFRAGGDESVRGYGYRELAPTDAFGDLTGGKVLFTSSVEVARPIAPSLPAVWWAAFVDAGTAADRWADLDPAVGLGLGLRWRSPVGPLRLDIARAQRTHKPRLHLSVGIVF
jgi:translocation and assembly module TamA